MIGVLIMKKIIASILVLGLALTLCSCGKNSATADSNDVSKNSVDDNIQKGSENANEQPQPITLDTPFSVGEIMTISLHNSEWCDKILPSNTSGTYSYMDDIGGEKYFVIRGELKNLASEAINIKYMSDAQMIINGKYKVPVTLELEESDGTSFYGNAKPLQTLNLIAYASVSDELYEACEDIQITINIINDESMINCFYDDNILHNSFIVSFDN